MVFIPALPLEDRSRNNVFVRQKLVALTFRIVTAFDEFFGHRITIVFSMQHAIKCFQEVNKQIYFGGDNQSTSDNN